MAWGYSEEERKTRKDEENQKEPVVGYVHTTDMPDLLTSLQISLVVSTYQAQRILLFSSNGERLNMLMRTFQRPTGLALGNNRLALCSKNQIWIFEVPSEIFNADGLPMPYDVCFVPRRSYVTGDIQAHDAAWIKDQLIIVNTRFSCLCVPSEKWSFEPFWKPRFITQLAAEDRCHLNGLACNESGPLYVTALGETNEKEAWRETRASGGVIIDVPSGEILVRGMAMPHSPRFYAGKLWVLESGMGELQVVDQKTGERTTVVRLPGYLRGLSFYDRYAFVGLCKIREKRTFGGLPIEEMVSDLQCAIHVIDIITGKQVGFMNFTKGIEELFDIRVLPGVLKPFIVGFADDFVDGLFILPS